MTTEHYIEGERRSRSAALQALPVPGRLARSVLRTHELELYPAAGHTADGVAFWMPWARVLVCGDYLSPVEIPMLAPAARSSAYAAPRSSRLAPLVEQAEWVIPGHGGPL